MPPSSFLMRNLRPHNSYTSFKALRFGFGEHRKHTLVQPAVTTFLIMSPLFYPVV